MPNQLFLTWRDQLRSAAYSDFGATVAGTDNRFEAALIHHLTADENQGRHHVYVDLVDGAGRLLRSLPLSDIRIGWTWEGRRPDEQAPPVALDKSLDEPAGNVPIYKGMKISIWLEQGGQRVSDVVSGLHGLVEDVGSGNTWHHNSFYVIFRERIRLERPPVEAITPTTPIALAERVTALEADVASLKKLAGMK